MYREYDFNGAVRGEYVFGDDVYIDDDYMDELWKQYRGFPEYWVSTHGRVWSDYEQWFIYGSPNPENGYIDFSLRRNGVRYHRTLHRMMGEMFIPNPYNLPFVRHLDDIPDHNWLENLCWGTRKDNAQDCIRNGNFKFFSAEDRELAMKKRRRPVMAIRFRDGFRSVYPSQQEASRLLDIDQVCISDVVRGRKHGASGYYFMNADEEFDKDQYEYAKKHFVSKCPFIVAINCKTGEEILFHGLTEAANALGMSIASISNVLREKQRSAKGWYFKYAYPEEDD